MGSRSPRTSFLSTTQCVWSLLEKPHGWRPVRLATGRTSDFPRPGKVPPEMPPPKRGPPGTPSRALPRAHPFRLLGTRLSAAPLDALGVALQDPGHILDRGAEPVPIPRWGRRAVDGVPGRGQQSLLSAAGDGAARLCQASVWLCRVSEGHMCTTLGNFVQLECRVCGGGEGTGRVWKCRLWGLECLGKESRTDPQHE